MKLRDYQREAIDAVYQVWHDKTMANPLVVAPTGSGKSAILGAMTAEITAHPDSRVIVLTHRGELIEQDADKIRKFTSEKVGIYSAGLNQRDMRSRIIVAGIASVYKRATRFEPFDVIIIDECFVAGTKILTPKGQVDIDKVRCGDLVFNQSGVGEVESISCKPVFDTLLIRTEDGRDIECTKNHKFFTSTGWRKAEELEVGTYLIGIEDMSRMWENIQTLDKEGREWRDNISMSGAILEKTDFLLSEVCKEIQSNEDGQRCEDENKQEIKRDKTQSYKSWRERAIAAYSTIGITTCARGWMGSRIIYKNTCRTQKWSLSELLQSRYWESGKNDCNRTGWIFTHNNRKKRKGFKKDSIFSGSRVVSISTIKRESPTFVFNLQVSGHPSYFANGIAVHNCHLISRNGNTMYGKFISEAKLANPRVKIVGLSATPFRMDSGYLHKGEGAMFDGIAYEIGVKMLLEMGYLSPLTSKSGSEKIDLSNVHKRGGEWIPSELAAMADNDSLTQIACDEICALGHNRKTWIVFCTSVNHALHVRDAMSERGISCEMVTGDTPKTERDDIYKRYNSGELRCITNCQVLTTGFDAPGIDLVALLTSTESTGLYVQMVGRGTRIAPNKKDCLLLDYGNNVITHGVFDDVKPKFKTGSGDGESLPPAKECPNCAEVLHAAVRHCPVCNHEFPPPAVIHNVTAYNGAVLSEQVKPELYEVTNVRYKIHKKAGKPDSIRIDYECGLLAAFSEWVCPEHEGFARRKFEQRCATEWKITPPAKCNDFLEIADNVPKPKAIYVRQVPGSKFNEITKREYQ